MEDDVSTCNCPKFACHVSTSSPSWFGNPDGDSLDTIEQIEDLGYEDYFHGPGVTIVEWAEKIQALLPEDHLEIRITGEDDARTFELRATGPMSEETLGRIRA